MYHNDPRGEELDELLRQVDDLLAGGDGHPLDGPAVPESGGEPEFDPDAYLPYELRQSEPILYRNYGNGYGTGAPGAAQPMNIPAYNADFRRERRQERDADEPFHMPRPEYTDGAEAPAPKKRRRRGRGCLVALAAPLCLLLALLLAVSLLLQPPSSDEAIGERKRATATVLVCGTDADGTRTDTMMLLYLSGSEKRVGLLSLPRDTYTIATAGYAAKLNSAYGRNNCGEEGMEALLDYMADIIGYRPDGYVLVNMDVVPKIVDRLGGVEVDVPLSFTEGSITLQQGLQRLNGEETLALLRHRSSYATADLKRVEMQRAVIKACMEQWISLDRLTDAGAILELVEENTLSSLSRGNYLWIAKTVLMNLGKGFVTETLPGHADYVAGGSYYLLDRQGVAELINQSFNPYKAAIDPADLNIAG